MIIKNILIYKLIAIFIVLSAILPYPVIAKVYEQPTNITGFADLMTWNNRVLSNMFGVGVLIVVFFTSFVLLKGFESRQAFVGCLFFTLFVSIGLRLLNVLNTVYVIGSALICGLIILMVFFTKE